MGDGEGYNGWANRQTWLVALHIDNEQSTYERRRELARDALVFEASEGAFAEALEGWVADLCGEFSGLVGDIVGDAFGRVDWREIAHGWLVEERDEVDPVDFLDVEGLEADGYDCSSSASRQHWIETGEFLKVGEVLEVDVPEHRSTPNGCEEGCEACEQVAPAVDADPLDGVVREILSIRDGLVVYSINDVAATLEAARERLEALANGLS